MIEGADDDTRDAIRELLPDRERPTSLFEAERIAEEAAERATAWLRSEGYYGATVTPEAREEPAEAKLVIEMGPRFSFAANEFSPNFEVNPRGAETRAGKLLLLQSTGVL